ncbi:MAG TPA: tetratricopeptide repeat protein [Rhizomicrobium sp.]
MKRPANSRSGEALERAGLALRMNQPGEAERLASEILKAERSNVMAASLLGQALLAQNRAEEAVSPLEKAARRSGDPSLETLLAIALASSGQNEDALAQLRKTTVRRPLFPPAFRELAAQLNRRGEIGAAIAVLEECLAQVGNIVELQVDLATLYLNRNARSLARETLTRALAAAPGRPDIVALLARVMLLDGDYAAAADAYRHVLAVRPDDVVTRAEFAVCEMEMGEREAGEANLRVAMRGRPDMLYRAIGSLAAPAHGRLFLRQSAAMKFLNDKR